MAASLAMAGEATGIRFDNSRKVHNTIRSHRLVRFADGQGKGGEMIDQLFHAYFEQGRNIADVDVLLELAEKVCTRSRVGGDTPGHCRLSHTPPPMFLLVLLDGV